MKINVMQRHETRCLLSRHTDVDPQTHRAAFATEAEHAVQRTLVAASGAAVLLSRRSVGAGSPWGGPGAGRDTPVEMR